MGFDLVKGFLQGGITNSTKPRKMLIVAPMYVRTLKLIIPCMIMFALSIFKLGAHLCVKPNE